MSTLGRVLFVLAWVALLAPLIRAGVREVRAWRATDHAIERLRRQRQAPLGVHGRVRGYEITERTR